MTWQTDVVNKQLVPPLSSSNRFQKQIDGLITETWMQGQICSRLKSNLVYTQFFLLNC